MLLNDKANQNKVKKAAQILRAVNHPLRRSILETIETLGNKVAVTEIYVKLRLEQSVASQHLAILRKGGVVKTTREGKFIFYTVREKALLDLLQCCQDLDKVTQPEK